MRKYQNYLVLILLLCTASSIHPQDWPKEIKLGSGTKIMFYQPQIESFDKVTLEVRAAVMVQPAKQKDPVFGAVWVKSKVLTDRDTRLIKLDEVQVTNAKFPDQDSAKVEQLKTLLVQEIPKWDLNITIDQLIASLETQKTDQKEKFKTDPPEVIHVTYPAVLISIDGDPVMKPLETTAYEYVINTPFFIVSDKKAGKYFLKGGLLWYQSDKIMEGWKWTKSVPQDLLAYLKKKAPEEDFSVNPDTIKVKPEIIVRTKPAELIQTDGKPELASVEGTSLLYVKNTDTEVIVDINSQTYFILISGRWFQGKSLEGPWTFIEPDKLPADFAKIPSDSDLGGVLTSVPGTEEAKDAILDSQIPQTAKVDRNTKLEVKYDGEPKFEKITDSDLSYAVNTDKSVIKYNDKYYCCDNAVWFEAPDAKGPWKVATEIPDAIYKMDPESPVYNTKYVYVYDSTPEVVYVGYYPGYVGSYVYGGTVIYGTGYYYYPWYGAYYYPRPVTYGFSLNYNPYMGWSFGFGMSFGGPAGWFSFSYHSYPYHGGYWGAGGYHAGYHHGYHQGVRNGYYAGYRAGSNNQYNDGNRNVYRDGNRGTVSTNDKQRNRNNVSTQDKQRNNVSTMDKQRGNQNNVYSDKQGNVYKKENNQWQSREGNNWNSVDKSKNNSSYERNKQDLNKQYDTRQKSNQKTQTYNQQRSTQTRSYNRGGSRGGRR